MRRFWVLGTVSFVVLLLASPPGMAQFYQQRSQATPAAPPSLNHLSLHDTQSRGDTIHARPHSVGQTRVDPPATPAARPASPPPNSSVVPRQPSGGDEHHHHRHGASPQPWLLWNSGYPLIWSGPYTPAFGVYAPVYPYFQPNPFNNAGMAVAPVNVDPPIDDPIDARPARAPRATNAETKAKAGKFVGFGDANFSKQKYAAAVERYRTAGEMAPDLAEPYFRQGFALVAMGQFENATRVFRRALKIRPDWSDSPFRLDQIYGNDQLAKTTHLENLAKAIEANPLSSDLLVALGIQLYFDGQRERAGVFLVRAVELGANEDHLLNGLLPKPGPAGAAQPAAGGKVVF